MTERLLLGTGALIALERNDRRMWARLAAAADATLDVVVPAGALAQTWRGTPRQVRLGQVLGATRTGPFDSIARARGERCRTAQTADPIAAGVVLNATGAVSVIVTSDEGDIGRIVDALGSDVGTGISILKA